MSRIRFLFRSPPFQSAYQPRLGPNHVSSHQLELPLQSRIRWSYFWYAGILSVGIATGLGARQFAAPLGLPVPGSPEDRLILKSLDQDIDRLDIVQSLRKQSFNLHSDTPIVGTEEAVKFKVKGWVEVDVDLVKNAQVDELGGKGILGAISGTQGLGVQRAFWNDETKEMVAVIWIGGGLSGWPSVAHGGAIATIFEEIMARMVKGPVGPVEPRHRPASISITYAKPTHTLDFYVIRAAISSPELPQIIPPSEPEAEPTRSWLSWLSPKKDLTKKVEPKRSAVITGTLGSIHGDLCVKFRGTFDA